MDFSKKNLEHCGTLHVPYKYVGLFRKRFKLTKVPKWPSFLMLNLIFKVKFAIEIKLDTEKIQIHNKLGAR